MEIIPAIDIMDGQCVRLTQGRFDDKEVYETTPLGVAQRFEAAGLRRLHLVDLDGARAGQLLNLAVLAEIARETSLSIDFGGGITSDEDLERVFAAGAAQAAVGTIAVRNPALFERWLGKYGPERLILAADAKGGMVAVRGWQEEARIRLPEFLAEKARAGVRYVACTEIERDGAMRGPAVDLYRSLTQLFPELRIVASGGVAILEDLAALRATGVWGVIIGKAIYRGTVRIEDLAALQGAEERTC